MTSDDGFTVRDARPEDAAGKDEPKMVGLRTVR
jgi:hypothetical protein